MKTLSHTLLILLLLLLSHGVDSVFAHPPIGEGSLEEDTNAPIEITIHPSRYFDLIREAESASSGFVGSEIFKTRPLLRPGELIETVPGIIATQHAGGGKANQYFFRGFNLDHGTDFRTEVDGMPVNLVSHGHGQGYTDLNFLIPELVDYIDYQKGSYKVEKGDFSTAGSADFILKHHMPKPEMSLTIGEYDYKRLFTAGSLSLRGGSLLAGLEVFNYDGPWVNKEDSRKFNAVLRYSTESARESFNILFMGYRGIWNSSDQIPLRAVENMSLPRLGTLDPTTGGDSNRFSLSSQWERVGESGNYKANAYLIYYDLDLYSNFTYFLDNPELGDQFKQEDQRVYFGGALKADHTYSIAALQNELAYGLELRHDNIPNVALRRTSQRQVLSTVREDEIRETQVGLHLKNKTNFSSSLRSYIGLRADYIYGDVNSINSLNSGGDDDFQLSPKAGIAYSPWYHTEFYINGGVSFHSNDVRGATSSVDPETLSSLETLDILTEARGSEIGVRSSYIEGLTTSFAAWFLELDNELVFVGDAGTTEVQGASERYGIELSNFYQVQNWLSLYLDYSYTRPRFKDEEEDKIPNSIEHVLVGGANFRTECGFIASGKWRYLGTRNLNGDGSAKAPVTSLVDLRLGYEKENYSFYLDIFNVFNEDDFDIAYFYTSRLNGESSSGVDDIHFHPVEPRQARVSFAYKF